MTNGDRIRQMADEELEVAMSLLYYAGVYRLCFNKDASLFYTVLKKWLKMEVKDETD